MRRLPFVYLLYACTLFYAPISFLGHAETATCGCVRTPQQVITALGETLLEAAGS